MSVNTEEGYHVHGENVGKSHVRETVFFNGCGTNSNTGWSWLQKAVSQQPEKGRRTRKDARRLFGADSGRSCGFCKEANWSLNVCEDRCYSSYSCGGRELLACGQIVHRSRTVCDESLTCLGTPKKLSMSKGRTWEIV